MLLRCGNGGRWFSGRGRFHPLGNHFHVQFKTVAVLGISITRGDGLLFDSILEFRQIGKSLGELFRFKSRFRITGGFNLRHCVPVAGVIFVVGDNEFIGPFHDLVKFRDLLQLIRAACLPVFQRLGNDKDGLTLFQLAFQISLLC